MDGAIVVAGKNNKNWDNKKVAVARPHRVWNEGPYQGTVIDDVPLGTILSRGATASNKAGELYNAATSQKECEDLPNGKWGDKTKTCRKGE